MPSWRLVSQFEEVFHMKKVLTFWVVHVSSNNLLLFLGCMRYLVEVSFFEGSKRYEYFLYC
jgi:hypothetical protein